MAKTCMVQRELRRQRLVKKYAPLRAELKLKAASLTSTDEERFDAQMKLQKLPRDSAKTRIRNRCEITGRPHGYYRHFGLARNKLREYAMFGYVPGLRKASW